MTIQNLANNNKQFEMYSRQKCNIHILQISNHSAIDIVYLQLVQITN